MDVYSSKRLLEESVLILQSRNGSLDHTSKYLIC